MDKRILVVDDSPFIHELVNDILLAEGYEIEKAMDGREAMVNIGENPPDLVLLDIIMPEMSGYQVCRLIRSDDRLKAIPVVMMTAKDTQKDRFWGMEVGADAYITKPIEQQALLDTISSLLEEKREPVAPVSPEELTIESLKGRADDILERKLLELTIINEVGKLYTFLDQPDALLENALRLISRVVDYDLGSIFVAFPGASLKHVAFQFRNRSLKVSKKVVIREGSRILSEAGEADIAHYKSLDTRIIETNELENEKSRKKSESDLKVTLESSRGTLGCIMLYSHKKNFFIKDDRALVEMIASQLAMLMENVLLLQERDRQLLVLELEKNRVEAILRNMGEGVIVTDWSYNIIHSNPLAHTLLGLDAGELEGKLLFEHVPKEIFSILEEQPIGESNPTWNVRFQSVKEDFPLVASVAVVDEKGEQTLGLILLLRDITAERELDNLRSRFLENISNQIMNPLASLLGFKDLLEEELKENITSRQSEYLDVMGEEVTKLTEIVEDLLSLTRIELADFNLTPAAMPLAEAILAAISSLQNDAGKKEITLKTEIPPDLTEIYADRESVVDITTRVLSNAIKFSPPGVEVKVGARPIAEDGGTEMVEIYIKDPGPGIPVDRRDSLFEKYQSHKLFAEVDSRNVGLGLPICKRLVEMNGGRIGYSVPAEGGSEFHFTFPVREKVGV